MSAPASNLARTDKLVETPVESRVDSPVEPRAERPVPDDAAPPPVEARAAPAGPAAPATPNASSDRARGKRALRAILMIGGVVAVAAVAGAMWLRGGRYVSVDNAYVRAAKLMVTTDVSGVVQKIDVKQGQSVEKGQTLFSLDPRQFEIALASAQAQLAQARLDFEGARKDYQRIQDDIATQQAVVGQARAAFARAQALAQRSAGSQATYDQTRFALAAEESKLRSLQQQSQAALTRLGGDANAPVEANPRVRDAQARVDEARRQLDHTVVRAPFAGVVTSVESLQPGLFLVAPTAALTNNGAVGLVSTQDQWIEANVKETDLTYAKPGDPVEIEIDAYPGHVWRGRLDSIFPASGAEFSILPAQNASGNWVKVVQRIPVRIAIDRGASQPALRAGLSAVVTIDTGHTRSLTDLRRLVGLSGGQAQAQGAPTPSAP